MVSRQPQSCAWFPFVQSQQIEYAPVLPASVHQQALA
jgi:hypothetical protein